MPGNFFSRIATSFRSNFTQKPTESKPESSAVSLTISDKGADIVDTISTLKEIEDQIFTKDTPPKLNHENLQKFIEKYKGNISFSEFNSAITMHFNIPLSTNSTPPENNASRSKFIDYLTDDKKENVLLNLKSTLEQNQNYNIKIVQQGNLVRITFTKEVARIVIDKKEFKDHKEDIFKEDDDKRHNDRITSSNTSHSNPALKQEEIKHRHTLPISSSSNTNTGVQSMEHPLNTTQEV